MSYQYRGALTIEEELAAEAKTYGCGTYAGYRRHQRSNAAPCEDCREAARAYWRERDETSKTAPKRVYGFDPSACGTNAGYARHQRYNVEPCDPCRRATAQYIADYRSRKAAA